MKINNLTLTNFKGIPQLTVTLNGNDTTIYGNNGTGKTTIYDAFLFLLFGKDSQSNTKFSIKPINAPKGTEVSVTGTFEINEKTVELKKVLKENWTRKRGAMEETYAGDVTYCYVNEVPYKVTEYNEYIKGICDEEVFKLLTNPLHFNQNIKWQDRRKTLFTICGDVTDNQMFTELLSAYGQAEQGLKNALTSLQENPTDEREMAKLKVVQETLSNLKGYKTLHEAMGERTFEEFKKILADRRKSINKEIELIPTKINEASLSIIEVDLKLAGENLAVLKPQQIELETELNKVQTGASISKLNAQLSDLKTQLSNLERENNQHRNTQEDKQRDKNKVEIENLTEKYSKTLTDIKQLKAKKLDLQREMETQKKLEERYKKEQIAVDVQRIDDLETVCPTCNQPIPQEQLEQAKKTFDDNKNKKCKELSSFRLLAKEEALKMEKEIKNIDNQLQPLTTQEKLISDKLQALKNITVEYTDLQGYAGNKASLQAQIQATESELSNAKVNLTQEIERLKSALQTVRSEVEKNTKVALQDEQNISARQRISDYEVQQKDYIKLFEETEKQLYYCDLFTKKKVDLITEQVNSKFKIAKFKLFNTLVNGGIEDCCEVVVEGVPFSDLNNAMKINIGLDVIFTLQQHYKFAPPVFVDNAESVTDVYKLNSQMIKLVVPPSFESLPKEVQDNFTKADYCSQYNELKIESEDKQ